LLASAGKGRCGERGDCFAKKAGSFHSFDYRGGVEPVGAKMCFEVSLGSSAEEFESLEGLWYEVIDQRINDRCGWYPSLAFSGLDLQLGGG